MPINEDKFLQTMASATIENPCIGRFDGKVAICTASSAGIGLAVAERLAQEGAKVVLSSRRKENVEDAVEKLRAKNLEVSGIACHQAKKEDRQRLIDFAINTYGGLDVLFISAGVNPHRGSLLKVTEQQWDKLFDVNVKSTFLMIRECVPHLSARGGGAIVTNSTAATLFPDRMGHNILPYIISKSCLTGLTKVLGPVLYRNKIRLNCIAPGPIATRFFEGSYKSQSGEKVSLSLIKESFMMKRSE
ncbi:putative dehydrogenase/reductase SDR family member 4 [Apostichopus japonicus]|uniref:Putative dehydrogenase/reductase SDR family member 4 n=1 Tax=Stichopus japonicus TaxID=307972 RepID=A0A2G8JHJ1_STIJA|nr:putative dehydrogenase/reductase SDR family member 4 [Apostichopus japonicus]